MRVTTFRLPEAIKEMPHRDRILAKRVLYDAARNKRRPFGLIELFDTADRRDRRLPHQGKRECARRIKAGLAS